MQLNQSSAASAKQKANTDDEDRETPPDQIITAKRFMTAKSSKASSPMDDGPSYIDKSTTKNLADLNLKNQLSGAQGTSSSKSGSVQEFESRKNKFNKQIGVKELRDFIQEEGTSSNGAITASNPTTTKARDAPDLEFKKPGEKPADDQRDLHRVTSYNNIVPMTDEMSSNNGESEQTPLDPKERGKPSAAEVANQLNINDPATKNLYEEVMGVSPVSDQSFKHSDLNDGQGKDYFKGLKMDPHSQATSTGDLGLSAPMISPTSHVSPLSNPIKIEINEKPRESHPGSSNLFESVNPHAAATSPLSQDSAIAGINKGSFSISSSTSKNGDDQPLITDTPGDITAPAAQKPEVNTSAGNITFGGEESTLTTQPQDQSKILDQSRMLDQPSFLNQTNEEVDQDPIVTKNQQQEPEQQVNIFDSVKQRPPQVQAALKEADNFADEIFYLLIQEMKTEFNLLVNRNVQQNGKDRKKV